MSILNIKGIFFSEVAEVFDALLQSASEESGLSQKELQKKLGKKIRSLVDTFDDNWISVHIQNNKFSLEHFLSIGSKNQKAIVQENFDSFNYFIIYINSCDIIYNECCKAAKGRRISKTDQTSIALYGIIVRRSQQIVSLLIDGYADAAMIIWRSMYENIIALLTLIENNDDTLTDKFFAHSVKNTKKKIVSYNNNRKELRFRPLPRKIHEELNKSETWVNERYGKTFIENEFGWADALFTGKQKASLRMLEEKLKLQRYRPYYLLCSEHIHLGFNTFKNYMRGNKIIVDMILEQNTELNKFIDPMQFTVSILHEVNDHMLHKASAPHEYSINIKLLERIFKLLLETFQVPNKKATKKI